MEQTQQYLKSEFQLDKPGDETSIWNTIDYIHHEFQLSICCKKKHEDLEKFRNSFMAARILGSFDNKKWFDIFGYSEIVIPYGETILICRRSFKATYAKVRYNSLCGCFLPDHYLSGVYIAGDWHDEVEDMECLQRLNNRRPS
jgi:hypothetical protein